jgi:hypothetical protein
MDNIEEYRKRARERYETERIKKEREQREIEERHKEEERKKLEEIQKKIDEQNAKKHKALSILWEVEEHIDSLQFNNSSENIFYSLSMIESLLQININFLKEEEKINELHNIILNLINILNMLNENNNDKKDLTVLKGISETMKTIFKLAELDIKIELMDTTNDENFAKEFNKKLNNLK